MDNTIDLAIEEAKEQEREEKERKAKADLKKALMAGLKGVMPAPEEQQVKVPLSEYISLMCMVRDFDTLRGVILESLELSYSGDDLRLAGDEVLNACKVLFNADLKLRYTELKEIAKLTKGV